MGYWGMQRSGEAYLGSIAWCAARVGAFQATLRTSWLCRRTRSTEIKVRCLGLGAADGTVPTSGGSVHTVEGLVF